MENTNILSIFLHIAGAAALLIWSVRLVRTGVERAFTFNYAFGFADQQKAGRWRQ